jgi:hypothetical protein
VRLRYARANKTQQTKTLDEFVAVTGYNRKYDIHLLNHPPFLSLGNSCPIHIDNFI